MMNGVWSVSVAENDPHSYSLYIKTPTHNLTLTRGAMELVDLDARLRGSHPEMPPLPIDPQALPPQKRKSTFLNTLSRLASPSRPRQQPIAPHIVDDDPQPAVLPASQPAPSATSTALAAYLTTVANHPNIRLDRVWKRFVRVRTDDLQSQRADRPIKRVRSDLAAHNIPDRSSISSSAAGQPSLHPIDTNLTLDPLPITTAHSATAEDLVQGLDEAVLAAISTTPPAHHVDRSHIHHIPHHPDSSSPDPTRRLDAADRNHTTAAAAGLPSTYPSSEHTPDAAPATTNPASAARIQRSQSVDPDQSHHRLSRIDTPMQDAIPAPHPATPAAGAAAATSSASDPSSVLTKNNTTKSAVAAAAIRAKSSGALTDVDSGAVTDGALVNNSRRKHRRRSKKPSSSLTPSSSDAAAAGAGGAAGKQPKEPKKSQRKVCIADFEMMRVLGKGCAGKVLLVRHKATSDLFALKAITKRHVLAHQELQHTLTEQAVLKRMAHEGRDPFVVKLWWSFHDKENLFLVMDFHPGGDLATQLARWGRLGRDRARFYAAEIVEGVEGLHAAGVIYRDLKPENILIAADGHIVLTDFGLSKEFPSRRGLLGPEGANNNGNGNKDFYSSVPGTPQMAVSPPWMKPDRNGEMALGWPGQPIGHTDSTTTFCGTAEYLAPEVIQGLPYSYEVDWWSFGTMLYEMLTGITPFWANNHSDMYVRVLQDELQFPDDRAIDHDTKSLIRGLLQRAPTLRICEPRIKKHPYFSMIDWSHVYYKRYIPPYIPPVDPSNKGDVQNFDDTFLDMEPVLDEYIDETEDTNSRGGTGTETETETDRAGTTTDADDEEEGGRGKGGTPSQSRSSSVVRGSGLGGRALVDEDVDGGVKEGSVNGNGSVGGGGGGSAPSSRPGTRNGVVNGSVGGSAKGSDVGRDGASVQPLPPPANAAAARERDVFDGYSFKGRHSVLLDDEDEDEEGHTSGTGTGTGTDDESIEEGEEGSFVDSVSGGGSRVDDGESFGTGSRTGTNTDADGDGDLPTQFAEEDEEGVVYSEVSSVVDREVPEVLDDDQDLDEEGPKTPEARKVGLPVESGLEDRETPRKEEQEEVVEDAAPVTTPVPSTPPRNPLPLAPITTTTTTTATAPSTGAATRPPRSRREKSGIAALDAGNDSEAAHAGAEEDNLDASDDDDWDLIDKVDGEDRNGSKGTSLFARGVVDRYRLAVVFNRGKNTSGGGGMGSPASVRQSRRVVWEEGEEGHGVEDESVVDGGADGKSRGRRGRGSSAAMNFRRAVANSGGQFLRPKDKKEKEKEKERKKEEKEKAKKDKERKQKEKEKGREKPLPSLGFLSQPSSASNPITQGLATPQRKSTWGTRSASASLTQAPSSYAAAMARGGHSVAPGAITASNTLPLMSSPSSSAAISPSPGGLSTSHSMGSTVVPTATTTPINTNVPSGFAGMPQSAASSTMADISSAASPASPSPSSPSLSVSAVSLGGVGGMASLSASPSLSLSFGGGGGTSHGLNNASTSYSNSRSLKSKQSATSMGALSQDSSVSGDANNDVMSAVMVEAPDMSSVSIQGGGAGGYHTVGASSSSPSGKGANKDKGGGKKLKRYKNNAEKVFSLFSIPTKQGAQEKERERERERERVSFWQQQQEKDKERQSQLVLQPVQQTPPPPPSTQQEEKIPAVVSGMGLDQRPVSAVDGGSAVAENGHRDQES